MGWGGVDVSTAEWALLYCLLLYCLEESEEGAQPSGKCLQQKAA